MQHKYVRDLTEGSIPRHLLTFSLPILTGSLLQTAYSIVNAIWVGKFLGTAALAAVTVSFPIIFALIAIAAGLTLATNIQVSQLFGAKDFAGVRKVIDSSAILIGALSVILLIAGELAAERALRAMDTPTQVLPLALTYLRIFLLSLPFAFGLFLIRNVMQGMGDSKTPLYFQAVSVAVTAVLDPLLMFGWLGFPRLGVNGTAWAAVTAHIGVLVSLVVYLTVKRHPAALRWHIFPVDWDAAFSTVKIGIPSAAQQALVSIGMVFVTGIVNRFGETATAAFGAASRIDQIAFMPAMAFGIAVSTLAGQNIGAKKHHRVHDVFKAGVIVSGSVTLLISAFAVIFPRALLRMFLNDEAVLDQGVTYLHIVGACYICFAVMFIANGIINGSGRTFVTTIFTLISLWIVRVPLAYALSRSLHNVIGVWYAIAAGLVTAMIISVGYYSLGTWKKPLARNKKVLPVEVFAEETADI